MYQFVVVCVCVRVYTNAWRNSGSAFIQVCVGVEVCVYECTVLCSRVREVTVKACENRYIRCTPVAKFFSLCVHQYAYAYVRMYAVHFVQTI